MKATSQLLIATRLLNTIERFCARLNIFSDAGRVQLYCLNQHVFFVELGDLFPASWLGKMMLSDVAASLRAAASAQEKVQLFRVIIENPEFCSAFKEAVKKHLKEFFNYDVKKCELRADHFLMTSPVLSLWELLHECGSQFLDTISYDELIPSNTIVFQQASDYLDRSSKLNISLQQGYLLSRLDRPLTVSEILSTVPSGEDVTKRNLIILWAFGLLDSPFLNQFLPNVASRDLKQTVPLAGSELSSRPQKDQIRLVEETYQGLSKKDFYSLLGISSKVAGPEIKAAYYKLARQFHPDRFYGIDDPVLKEKIDVIFSTINIAYETLKNSSSRTQYDNKPPSERGITTLTYGSNATVVSPGLSVGQIAEDYYHRAAKSYQSKNYYEAVQYLRSATQISPEVAKYWTQLGVVLSKNEQWRKEAEDSFHRAAEIDPSNAENHLYLAFLYKNSGLKLRAKKCFMNVLRLDPKNDVALTEIQELEAEESQQKKGILGGIFKARR